MTINLGTPRPTELKPKISVIGIGGAGGNAVNNMISANLEGVEFIAINTDAQALSHSLSERTVQLGTSLTQGLGAGSKPEVGRAAAMEAQDEIMDHIQGSHMAFVTAGMGGGTGTGAAPVIAQLAREAGLLTVGVVTKPFQFEGAHRMSIAEAGILELQSYVDTLLVIPNQNLFRVANERTTFADAFKMADDVLHAGVRGVTDLMVLPGLINLDFADVRAVMEEMGKAMMGTGEAEGDKRALEAAEAAISNPLLEDTSMRGACGILINITGGPDMTLFEVDEAVNRIKEEVDDNANIIFGSTFDERMEGRMRVSIVATGIDVAADSVLTPRLQIVSAVAEEAPAGEIPRESRATLAPEPSRAAEPRFPLPGIAAERAPAQPSAFAEPAAAVASAAASQPEARSAPVTTTALRSMTSAQAEPEEAFIVPPPVEARAPLRPPSAPDPFAEAAVTNGGEPRRGGPSLLERMTGLGRRKAEAEAQPPPPPLPVQARPAAERPLPEAMAYAVQPAVAAAGLPPEPEPEQEPTPAPSPARLNVDAADRIGAPAEDALLEIPTFLRRQAN